MLQVLPVQLLQHRWPPTSRRQRRQLLHLPRAPAVLRPQPRRPPPPAGLPPPPPPLRPPPADSQWAIILNVDFHLLVGHVSLS